MSERGLSVSRKLFVKFAADGSNNAHISRLALVIKLASWPTPQSPRALRRLWSGHTAPCHRRSGICQISPAFKWLTSLLPTYSRTYRTERNGAVELSYWDCTAAHLGRNGRTPR